MLVVAQKEVMACETFDGYQCTGTPPPSEPMPGWWNGNAGVVDWGCDGGLSGQCYGPGGSWSYAYLAYYEDPGHHCSLGDTQRQDLAANAVRGDVISAQGSDGIVAGQRLEIRGTGGSRESFDVVGGRYSSLALVYGSQFIQLVPGSCRSGGGGT